MIIKTDRDSYYNYHLPRKKINLLIIYNFKHEVDYNDILNIVNRNGLIILFHNEKIISDGITINLLFKKITFILNKKSYENEKN